MSAVQEQALCRELGEERMRATSTSRKLEQCRSTCAELRESLALAQDTVGTGLLLAVTLHSEPPTSRQDLEKRLMMECLVPPGFTRERPRQAHNMVMFPGQTSDLQANPVGYHREFGPYLAQVQAHVNEACLRV